MKAGVRIAFGTDSGIYPHGWNARQFAYQVRYGQTPLEAIRSRDGRRRRAAAAGRTASAGSRRAAYADLVARGRRPDSTTSGCSRTSRFVMKGGRVLRSP